MQFDAYSQPLPRMSDWPQGFFGGRSGDWDRPQFSDLSFGNFGRRFPNRHRSFFSQQQSGQFLPVFHQDDEAFGEPSSEHRTHQNHQPVEREVPIQVERPLESQPEQPSEPEPATEDQSQRQDPKEEASLPENPPVEEPIQEADAELGSEEDPAAEEEEDPPVKSSDPSKMKLLLVHGANKQELELPTPNLQSELDSFYAEVGEESSSQDGQQAEEKPQKEEPWTVGRLKSEVERLTAVPVSGMRLILRGKSLADDAASTSALGLRDGDKLMVLGAAKPSEEEDATGRALGRLEKETVSGLRQRLEQAESELSGMESGFLPRDKWPEARKQLDKRLKYASEECMRALLSLDGLAAANESQRKRRKALVLLVQELLNRHDALVDRLAAVPVTA